MVDIRQLLDASEIAKGWLLDVRETYAAFHNHLTQEESLIVKVGRGGLSFYKETRTGPVFVCHFNAAPQRGKSDLGFADFRFDALREQLDLSATLKSILAAAPPEVQVKVNKLWCSLHFPLTSADRVAEIFVQHIIAKIE